MKRFFTREFIIIPLLGIILTLLLTWPFAEHLTTYFPSGGDGKLQAWTLWYDTQSLLNGTIFDQTRYFNGPQFYPLPYTMAFTDNLLLLSLLFAPVYIVSHNLSYATNLVMLGTFVLNFWSSYYVLKKVTKHMFASLIGAFIYTFNPISFAHFVPGHLNLATRFFLPLVFYFGYLFVTKVTWKNAFLFFLFFTLSALSSVYFEVFLLLCLPLFFIPIILRQLYHRKILFFKLFLIRCSALLLFLPILLYINIPYLQFSAKEGITRTLTDTLFFSAKPIDLIAGLPINLIYGPFIRSLDATNPPMITGGANFYYGHTLFLNIVPIILACIGVVWLIKRNNHPKQKSIWIGVGLVFCFSFVMMFGPFFNGLKLPYYYLYTYLPFDLLQGIRAPARFEYILYIPFALFASFGAHTLLKKFPKQALLITSWVMLLLIMENVNVYNLTSIDTTFAQVTSYAKSPILHQHLDNKIVLHYPYHNPNADNTGSNALLWSTTFHDTVMNGNSGYIPPDVTNLLEKIDLNKQSDLDTLQALGVEIIVIHKTQLAKLPSLPANAIVYNDSQIEIVDFKKLPLASTFCTKADLHYELSFPNSVEQDQPLTYTITATNPNACYEVNSFSERYVESDVILNGIHYKNYLKFPVIIKPYEQTTIYSTVKTYKNQFDYLPTGIVSGKITIPALGMQRTLQAVILPVKNI